MFIGDQKSEKCCELDNNIENTSEPKMSFNNHYHLIEKNSSALNIMSGVKSLVSDMNGIIIAEMVYRCMICDVIYETIPEVSIHYQTKHIDQDLPEKGSKRSSHSTNVSFLNSFQLPNDPYSDQTVESSNSQTLTFDVPSGLKTLQQQFESSSKDSPQKKKKSLSSNESKSKMSCHQKPKVLGHMTGPTIKSGFITCEICGATKFYKYTQRRFGVYSCVGCAKFYSKYLLKPIAYKMCENLGKCNLKASECEPNGRCKACLIHKCRSKFIIDPKKLNHYRNESNNNNIKTNQKQISSKESKESNKTIKSSKLSLEFKNKSNSMSLKNKCEESPQNRINTSVNANKKCKSERSQLKTNTEKISKKSTNSSGISKPTVDKTTVLVKLKKNTSKTTEVDSKRTRNQLFCRKCLTSKAKDCNHFGNVSEPNKFKSRDKNRLSLKRTHCFTRSRNK